MDNSEFKLSDPKRKRIRSKIGQALPITIIPKDSDDNDSCSNWKVCLGHLKDKSIHVNNLDDIKHLYVNGFFGKGLNSKGAPEILSHHCAQEYSYLKLRRNKSQGTQSTTDPPTLQHEPLVLTLCEAFFLSYACGCLVVETTDGKLLTLTKMWRIFKELDDSFMLKYVVYHHFRSKGWVVRSGINYGVDFVLYKDGPPFYHSSYSVLICPVTDDKSENIIARDILPKTSFEMSCLIRTTEQVSKELLICHVIYPQLSNQVNHDTPECLSSFKVMEVIFKRWVSRKEREDSESAVS